MSLILLFNEPSQTTTGDGTFTAVADSTGAGMGAALADGIATAQGDSNILGLSEGFTVDGSFTSFGDSTASGIGAALVDGNFIAIGDSTADGIVATLVDGTFIAIGDSTATGITPPLTGVIGTAQGDSVASGFYKNYNGTSRGEAFACGVSARLVNICYDYQVGSIVYSCDKAQKGKMEKVVIKSVRVVQNEKTFYKPEILYVDTFNSLWNEYSLCPEEVARDYAIAHMEKEQELLAAALQKCHLT
jgi:hypothetical protein